MNLLISKSIRSLLLDSGLHCGPRPVVTEQSISNGYLLFVDKAYIKLKRNLKLHQTSLKLEISIKRNVEESKFLGIMFYRKLSFIPHINISQS